MFESLKQKIKHEIKNRQEARAAYKKAQMEERTRVQHIGAQKKMELRKQRIEKAKAAGVASQHRLEKLREKAEKIKTDPRLQQLAERAKQEAKRAIFGRPTRTRKHRRTKHRR